MSKGSIDTGATAQPVHTRTTADAVESQVAVVGVDGSDNVVRATPDGLAVLQAQPAAQTATWTSATSVNAAVTDDVTGFGSASISVIVTGTVTAGAISFEVSDDNATWFAAAATRVNAMVSEKVFALATGASQMWLISADGFTGLRVRLSTAITGAGSVVVKSTPSGAALEPFVAPTADTGTQTSVAGTASTNTTLLAANPARQAALIYNESASALFILLGSATESATVYSVQIPPNGYYEVPARYTGIIKGHWVTATGSARITELT